MKIIFGIFLALFALIFLAVGILALLGGRAQKKRCSASASGMVAKVHMEQKPRGRGKGTVNVYTPEFTFEANGAPQTYRASFASMRREFKEGQSVTIFYDPADPSHCYVAEDAGNSAQGGVMCAVIGALLAIAAVAVIA